MDHEHAMGVIRDVLNTLDRDTGERMTSIDVDWLETTNIGTEKQHTALDIRTMSTHSR